MKLNEKDWNDVADLFDQCAQMAEDSKETHSRLACEYVAEKNEHLALAAQARANAEPILTPKPAKGAK